MLKTLPLYIIHCLYSFIYIYNMCIGSLIHFDFPLIFNLTIPIIAK